MMSQTTTGIQTFRIVVFGLTFGMLVFQCVTDEWTHLGGPFRHLTIWGLTASTLSAWFMLQLSMGWSSVRREVFASVTVVLNLTVLLMYWKIYFEDPSLFYGADGAPAPWYEEYFLHGLGPGMQIFDALFLLGVFTRMKAVTAWVIALPVLYLSWIEFVIRPLNSDPVGSVTAGLPYLFLNNLDVAGRAMFYLTTTLTMLVLMLLAWGFAALIRRVRPSSPEDARSAPTVP